MIREGRLGMEVMSDSSTNTNTHTVPKVSIEEEKDFCAVEKVVGHENQPRRKYCTI